MKIHVATSLVGVDPDDWNRLADADPFLQHAFLHALHETGCASPDSGWAPHYLLLRDGTALVGAMPLYVKGHSYGEYVFDWAWADAHYRHGIEYYPKLIAAVPFTPVTGSRVLADTDAHRERLVAAALALARELRLSSAHFLFPSQGEAELMRRSGMMLRRGVQFRWSNHGYSNFDDFLAGMSHNKRKNIRQERRKIAAAGARFEWKEGRAIRDIDWQFFVHCYDRTYRAHRSTPYLTLDFFRRIGRDMPENLVMFVASRDGKPIAAALCLRNHKRLYGRYWGAVGHLPGLHFEACYYQGIEYCIARGLEAFEGGAQGEHKIARGLLPVETCSAHWLAHPEFSTAIDDFLQREGRGMTHYIDELNERNPFRTPATPGHGATQNSNPSSRIGN